MQDEDEYAEDSSDEEVGKGPQPSRLGLGIETLGCDDTQAVWPRATLWSGRVISAWDT